VGETIMRTSVEDPVRVHRTLIRRVASGAPVLPPYDSGDKDQRKRATPPSRHGPVPRGGRPTRWELPAQRFRHPDGEHDRGRVSERACTLPAPPPRCERDDPHLRGEAAPRQMAEYLPDRARPAAPPRGRGASPGMVKEHVRALVEPPERAPSRDEARRMTLRLTKSHYENFTLVSLLVPRRMRPHIAAVYAFCRTVDDIGDEAPGDRLALLDRFEDELRSAYSGSPRHPVIGSTFLLSRSSS